jgi:ribosomal protein L37AE/L43A
MDRKRGYKLLVINNRGKNNPNYRNGNRMTGNFPCPRCGKDRITERRYADKQCRDCYLENAKSKFSPEERRKRITQGLKDRRRTFKDVVVNLYGDRCWLCGNSYPQCVYTFHHLDKDSKEVTPAILFRSSNW